MRYEKDFGQLQLEEPVALSLGKFDGLHKGHEFLLRAVIEKKKSHLAAAVFTFDIPPASLADGKASGLITTNQEKLRLFELLGVDYLIECPFTKEMMHMDAEEFIRQVTKKLCVKYFIVGTDFRFGYQRRGDYRLLLHCAEEYGYQVEVLKKVQYGGRDISSTFIREEIQKGNMELTEELLGYPYFIKGVIIHGNQIGRTLGFPTINILPPKEKLLPPFGVYLSRVQIGEDSFLGITNIGRKPTINQENPVGVETYIYNFNKNVYGLEARVDILKFLRPEKKFQDLVELQEQLRQDIVLGRSLLQI